MWVNPGKKANKTWETEIGDCKGKIKMRVRKSCNFSYLFLFDLWEYLDLLGKQTQKYHMVPTNSKISTIWDCKIDPAKNGEAFWNGISLLSDPLPSEKNFGNIFFLKEIKRPGKRWTSESWPQRVQGQQEYQTCFLGSHLWDVWRGWPILTGNKWCPPNAHFPGLPCEIGWPDLERPLSVLSIPWEPAARLGFKTPTLARRGREQYLVPT